MLASGSVRRVGRSILGIVSSGRSLEDYYGPLQCVILALLVLKKMVLRRLVVWEGSRGPIDEGLEGVRLTMLLEGGGNGHGKLGSIPLVFFEGN